MIAEEGRQCQGWCNASSSVANCRASKSRHFLINHYALNPADPDDRKLLRQQMEEFFFGEGARMPEGWTPAGTGGSSKGGGAPAKGGGGAAPRKK
jgi:Fe-S cluster biosynthesis and repair protein YggX